MIVSAHFDNIQKEILDVLHSAKYKIYVAVAWITDKEIWNVLIDKVNEGVNVRIVLVEDEINIVDKFDFLTFLNSGGILYWDDHDNKFKKEIYL